MRLPFVQRREADVRAKARARLAAEERFRTFVPAGPPVLPTSDPLGMRTPSRAPRPRPVYRIVAVTVNELPAFIRHRLEEARDVETRARYVGGSRRAAPLIQFVPRRFRAPSDAHRPQESGRGHYLVQGIAAPHARMSIR